MTGSVLRAGRYTLYCDYRDDFVVIEPDEHPGWEVKVLHISGVRVSGGDRVVAGETVIAPGPARAPVPVAGRRAGHRQAALAPRAHRGRRPVRP